MDTPPGAVAPVLVSYCFDSRCLTPMYPKGKSREAVPTPNNPTLLATTIYDLPQPPEDFAGPQKRSRPVDKPEASMPFSRQKKPDWARKTGSSDDLIHRVGESVDILAGCSVDARIITCGGDLDHLSGQIFIIIFFLINNGLHVFGVTWQKLFCSAGSTRICG